MKHHLLIVVAALLFGIARVFGHNGVELGHNGGRILDFSKDRSLRAEVTLVNGVFRVALLDKDLKPVEIKDQSLAVTGGDRSKPEKPEVRREGNHFVFKALKGDGYDLVLRFKPAPDAKIVTARFTYDSAACAECKNPEWLCKCPSVKAGGKEKK